MELLISPENVWSGSINNYRISYEYNEMRMVARKGSFDADVKTLKLIIECHMMTVKYIPDFLYLYNLRELRGFVRQKLSSSIE